MEPIRLLIMFAAIILFAWSAAYLAIGIKHKIKHNENPSHQASELHN